MKIPKKLKIGGHIITVDCSEELKDNNGEFIWKENKIKICKTLPQSQKEATLLHEIFHVMNTTLNSNFHSTIDSLSEQMYQVLIDNHLLR